jgi:phosphopantetheinyl transferase (holo-ACP synthase)
VLLKRASERANEYRNLPWTVLMKDPNVPADQLQALQAEAQKAFEDETFLKNELDGFMQKVQEEQKVARVTAARECIKSLTTPESPHHIKGWNETVYNDIRTFATSQGVPTETVNAITDPGSYQNPPHGHAVLRVANRRSRP